MRRLAALALDRARLTGVGAPFVLALLAGGCGRPRPAAAPPAGMVAAASAARPAAPASAPPAGGGDKAGDKPAAEAPPRELRRCFPDRPSWVDAPVAPLLDRAADLFDAADYEGALACAEEAARQAPRSVEAHHDRAVALLHLDRVDDARDALALALALAPDDAETLEAAADLNINQLPPSADRSAIGLELARRGSRHVSRRDPERVSRLALLEGQALVDLGRAAEGLRRIDAALAAAPKMMPALYERGVALFELCRFPEARRMFEKVLAIDPKHGHALYHLGLIDERYGDDTGASRHLSGATAIDPKAFPAPPELSSAEFEQHVRRAVAALPADIGADLAGVDVEATDLPSIDDLTAEKPPLSPTILGLFRGLPLDWKADDAPPAAQAGRSGPAGGRGKAARAAQATEDAAEATVGAHGGGGVRCEVPARAIVLYRRNLLRTVNDIPELDRAITRTLLHEVGHLRGEDDGSLRDRGLE
jgi:tetratricopeptide (TPR) repeat protein